MHLLIYSYERLYIYNTWSNTNTFDSLATLVIKIKFWQLGKIIPGGGKKLLALTIATKRLSKKSGHNILNHVSYFAMAKIQRIKA